MPLTRFHFITFMLVALTAGSCVRTVFSPIWFGPSPNRVYAVEEKNDLFASASYMDADQGSGVSAYAVYSPKKYLMYGGGISHLSNKGLISSTTEQFSAFSNQWQAEISGGTYYNLRSGVLSLQAVGGIGYSTARSKINGIRVLDLGYQKLFLQPGLIIRLPNAMKLDFSYRFSQVYFTKVILLLNNFTSGYITPVTNIQRESPFQMGELGIGYTYNIGPMQTHIQYSIASPYRTESLTMFDTDLISTSLTFNISELRVSRKNKAEVPE